MFLAATKEERGDVARELSASLVGFCVDAVQYLIPVAMHEQAGEGGLGFEHAESGLMLSTSDGESRTFRWSQRGFDEGLWIGEASGRPPGAWVRDVKAIPVSSWRRFEGSSISSIAVAWQRIAPARHSIWSVRLDIAGQSVAIALGERDVKSGRLTYIPDCVVVIFDNDVAKRYRPLASLGSAWGEEENAESID